MKKVQTHSYFNRHTDIQTVVNDKDDNDDNDTDTPCKKSRKKADFTMKFILTGNNSKKIYFILFITFHILKTIFIRINFNFIN